MNSPSETYQNPGEQRREKLPGILLDRDFFADPAVIFVANRHGPGGPLLLLAIYMALGQNRTGKISEQIGASLGIPFDVPLEQGAEIIQTACSDGVCLLHRDETGLLFHPRIFADQAKIAAQREKWRIKKQQQSKRIPQGIPAEPAGIQKKNIEEEYISSSDPKDLKDPSNDQRAAKRKRRAKIGPDTWIEPEGHRKLLGFVYLTPEKLARVFELYQRDGLEKRDFERAIEILATYFAKPNPKGGLNRHYYTNDAACLRQSWVVQQVVAERIQRNRMSQTNRPQHPGGSRPVRREPPTSNQADLLGLVKVKEVSKQ